MNEREYLKCIVKAWTQLSHIETETGQLGSAVLGPIDSAMGLLREAIREAELDPDEERVIAVEDL